MRFRRNCSYDRGGWCDYICRQALLQVHDYEPSLVGYIGQLMASEHPKHYSGPADIPDWVLGEMLAAAVATVAAEAGRDGEHRTNKIDREAEPHIGSSTGLMVAKLATPPAPHPHPEEMLVDCRVTRSRGRTSAARRGASDTCGGAAATPSTSTRTSPAAAASTAGDVAVDARGCPYITDRAVELLAQKFHRHAVSFDFQPWSQEPGQGPPSTAITDAGLAHVARWCPNLVQLNLNGCGQVSNAGLALLAAACPKLEVLEIVRCFRITSEGLLSLAQLCGSLRHLNIEYNPRIPNAIVPVLSAICPQLEAGAVLLVGGGSAGCLRRLHDD
jgi:hypothetical protein